MIRQMSLLLLVCPSSSSRVLSWLTLRLQVAKRKGIAFDVVEKKLNDMDAVLPGLVNLHKAKASDWVSAVCKGSLAHKPSYTMSMVHIELIIEAHAHAFLRV